MKGKTAYRCKRCGDAFYCPTDFLRQTFFNISLYFNAVSCPRCGSTLIDEEQYFEEKKKQTGEKKNE